MCKRQFLQLPLLAVICLVFSADAFQPTRLSRSTSVSKTLILQSSRNAQNADELSHHSLPIVPHTRQQDGVNDSLENNIIGNHVTPTSILLATLLLTTPTPALAETTAGPIPSALLAWLHFVGIMGVAGGLLTERFLLQPGLSLEDEIKLNNADGIYGLSALSLLITGYFRVTQFAKGWNYYQHEPIFWLKMSAVAVLGGLSFFPAIVLFRRDQARQQGVTLPPLSDDLVERMSRIVNAELLALVSIPLLASLMARGVLYAPDFPWGVGVGLYVLCLGGAGYKYGTEAFQMMEQEGALEPVDEQ